MVKNNEFTIDDLIKLVKSITNSNLVYLIYKNNIEEIKGLLGDKFNEINEIINHLGHIGKFLSLQKSVDYHEHVYEAYKHISKLNKFVNKYNYFNKYDKLFINSIKKIHEELSKEKYKIGKYALRDFIINFAYYDNLDLNDNIDKFFDNIYNSYDVRDIDLDDIVEPIKDKQAKKDRKIWMGYRKGRIILSDSEKNDLVKRMSIQSNIERKIRDDLYDELEKKKEEREKLRKQQEIQRGGQLERLDNFLPKYIKYKTKYLNLKNKNLSNIIN